MKIPLLMALGSPALMFALGMAIAGTPIAAQEEAATRALNRQQLHAARAPGVAEAAPVASLRAQTRPLNQIDNIPEEVATARVTDASGSVIGAVQRVEIRNGRPAHVEIALMGTDTVVGLDASSLIYDAPNNVVTTSETLAQLMTRSRT